MAPYIFIGDFKIPVYPIALTIALIVFINSFAKRSEDLKINFEILFAINLVAVLVGSRLPIFFFTKAELKDVLKIWETGHAIFFGLLAGGITTLLYSIISEEKFLKILDRATVPVTQSLIIIRIMGCFMTGCCYGKPTTLPIGLKFPLGSLAGSKFPLIKIHPTQLYEAAILLIILIILKRKERNEGFDGEQTLIFIMLYSFGRFITDFFRADVPVLLRFPPNPYIEGLTLLQILFPLLALITTLWIYQFEIINIKRPII